MHILNYNHYALPPFCLSIYWYQNESVLDVQTDVSSVVSYRQTNRNVDQNVFVVLSRTVQSSFVA